MGLLNTIIYLRMRFSVSCPTPNQEGQALIPREVGKLLRSPSYPLIVQHSLSGSSAEICQVWLTLPVAKLLVAESPSFMDYAVLPTWFNINLQEGSAPRGGFYLTLNTLISAFNLIHLLGT
jgi:hypothetical protein